MESHPAAKRFMHEVRTSGKAKKWYASSIVRDCPTNVWGDEGTCAPLIELLELLTEVGRVGGGQLNGLMGCKPLTAFGHGDLNLSNVLVDVQGSLWLIDFAKSDVQGLFADAAKVLAVLLFEHFPTALGLAELQKIAAESLRDLERIMASFDLQKKMRQNCWMSHQIPWSRLPKSLSSASSWTLALQGSFRASVAVHTKRV